VAVVMKGGIPSYMRDGQFYAGGAFGGDLDKAVRGNPEAEAHARAYQDGMLAGFLTAFGGGVSMGTGAAVLLANGNPPNDRSPSAQTAGVVLLAGGLAAAIVGGVLYRNAEPHQWDAINIYNDGLADSTDMPRPPNARALSYVWHSANGPETRRRRRPPKEARPVTDSHRCKSSTSCRPR
jgi:hypothetical protein